MLLRILFILIKVMVLFNLVRLQQTMALIIMAITLLSLGISFILLYKVPADLDGMIKKYH